MNKIREKVLTVLNHTLIDLDTIDKLADRHGYHRFNLLRGELTELKNELDRIESEKPGDMEAAELVVKLRQSLSLENRQYLQGAVEFNYTDKEATEIVIQFAERYHQSRMGEK